MAWLIWLDVGAVGADSGSWLAVEVGSVFSNPCDGVGYLWARDNRPLGTFLGGLVVRE